MPEGNFISKNLFKNLKIQFVNVKIKILQNIFLSIYPIQLQVGSLEKNVLGLDSDLSDRLLRGHPKETK